MNAIVSFCNRGIRYLSAKIQRWKMALDIDSDFVDGKALGDGGFHLAYSSALGKVEIYESAVLAMHYLVAVCSAS